MQKYKLVWYGTQVHAKAWAWESRTMQSNLADGVLLSKPGARRVSPEKEIGGGS
jgi:hypothetical protein